MRRLYNFASKKAIGTTCFYNYFTLTISYLCNNLQFMNSFHKNRRFSFPVISGFLRRIVKS